MAGFLTTAPGISSSASIHAQKLWKQRDRFVAEDKRSLTVSNITSLTDIGVHFPPEQVPESVTGKNLWFYLERNTSVIVYMRQTQPVSIVYLANKDLIKSPLKAAGRILLPLDQALNCSDIVCH